MNDEKNIYDDEKTQYQNYDDEATQYDDSHGNTDTASKTDGDSESAKLQKKPQGSMWKKSAAGAGAGIVLGAAATILTSGTTPASEAADENGSHPDWTDGEISVSANVTDDMTFSEAFAAARAETGSGGVFEWHGYIYSTYTAEEWNGMTAEQRAEYGSHLKWSGEEQDTALADKTTVETTADVASDEVDVVEVKNADIDSGDEAAVIDAETEVEVLGVNVDTIEDAGIDGGDVVLVDIDNPGTDMDVDVYVPDDGIDYVADSGTDDYINDSYMQGYEG